MEKLNNPIESNVRAMFERIAERFGGLSGYGMETEVQDVEHTSYDGFIPFTNGGFRVMAMDDLSNGEGSGNLPKMLQKYVDQSHKDAAADFIRDREELNAAFEASESEDPADWLWKRYKEAEEAHGTGTLPLLPDLPRVSFWETPIGREREEFYEFDSEYMREGGEFWYEARAHYYTKENYRNKSGEDEIWFCSGINDDFTYGRDSSLNVLFERNVLVSELTPELLEELEAAMVDAVEGA